MTLVIVSYIIYGLILSVITLVQEIVSERRKYKNHYKWICHMYNTCESNNFNTLEDYMNYNANGQFLSHKQDLEQFAFQKHNWLNSLVFSLAAIIFGTLTWPIWVVVIFFKGGHNIV